MPKFLTSVDMTQREIQRAVTHPLASAPASPIEGQNYYDTTLKLERYWNGTTWVSLGDGGGAVDLYVDITGDTMTGQLNAPSIALGADPATQGAVRIPYGYGVWTTGNPDDPNSPSEYQLIGTDMGQIRIGPTVTIDPVSGRFWNGGDIWVGGSLMVNAGSGVKGIAGEYSELSFDMVVWDYDTGHVQLGMSDAGIFGGELLEADIYGGRINLYDGVGPAATITSTAAQFFGDISAPNLRAAAFMDVGTTAGTVAAGDDPRFGGGGGAVASVDGRVGAVVLSDLYVDVAGDNMTGNLGLGVPVPTAKLHFAADTTTAGGIQFGNDVYMYRSGATTLYAQALVYASAGLSAGGVVQASSSSSTGGFRLGSTGPKWVSGAGTPEGVVTAPIGSMYSRTDGGANTSIYRKETGTGNTGWVATSTATGGVTSVDGRTGVVALNDLYVDVAGDTMTGPLDLSKNELRNAVTHKLATAPSSPVEGQRYYDTALKSERFWNGTAWVAGGGSGASAVWVGPDAPTGTAKSGDQWYDTDDPSVLQLPVVVASGGTGATTATLARANLAVPAVGNSASVAGAPTTGTWARGDTWLDSANVLWSCTAGGTPGTWAPPVGYELAYNQITANVGLTATTGATAQLVIDGGTRTYDGLPVLIEFVTPMLEAASGQWTVVDLWDGATDLGQFVQGGPGPGNFIGASACARRRLTPTPGSHNYKIMGWVTGGTGKVYAGTGAAGSYVPAFIRVTRA